MVRAQLTQAEFSDGAIGELAQMAQIPAHAFLHKKHRALALRLSATLAELKREGLVDQYRLQAARSGPDDAGADPF